MQTQTSNSLHNAIMEAGSKDRPPMLAPGNYIQWKSRIKRYIDTKPNRELIHFCLTNPPYELVNEIRAEKITRVANPLALVAQQQQVSHPQTHPTHYNQHSSTRTHQAATRKREKAIVNSPQPIYDSLSFKKIYKPTNNNLRTSSNISRANQDNSPRIYRNAGYEGQRSGTVAGARETKPKRAKEAAYHREKMLFCKQEEAGIQLNAEQADWKDDTDDESDDQELEAHYMYMAKLQQVSPNAVDSGPIFDKKPEHH
nr:hypothetical protein [Tanacetum cinerariifolium]